MEPEDITPNDVVMVDIDGNAVACTALIVEEEAVKFLDHGSGRTFWRSLSSLRNAKRFNGHITTYVNYPDWLKQNKPDVEIRFLHNEKKKKVQKAPKAEKKLTTKELAILREMAKSGELQQIMEDLKKKEDPTA